MGLGHNSHAAFSRVGEDLGQLDLSSRVKMDFRLFDVDYLTRSGCAKRRQDWQKVRYPQPHIGDTDEVVRVALFEPIQQQVDLSVVQTSRDYALGQADPSEIRIQVKRLFTLTRLPEFDYTCDVVLEGRRKTRSERGARYVRSGLPLTPGT